MALVKKSKAERQQETFDCSCAVGVGSQLKECLTNLAKHCSDCRCLEKQPGQGADSVLANGQAYPSSR